MGPEGAVNIIHRRDIQTSPTPDERREKLIGDYKARFANPYSAAERGYIDDVIVPARDAPEADPRARDAADQARGHAQAQAREHPALARMERVTGIGGFFFRSRDPGALAEWYLDRLGVDTVPASYDEGSPWRQEEGETVFAPFPQDSKMIGPPEHTWMINFRVEDLDAMVEQLRAAGESVELDPERYPNGRFAALRDPEGNGIQLWQPMDAP